ncbi:response regulator [Catenovulum maritimum]|uniref:response regulator n=1 Tax=Catenovulum maritimum TaxID=1513271 RepID=UPI0006616222|nr:response regulator [Catenovulum maritimum]
MDSILIVDDDKLNLKNLSNLLVADYQVILAKNGSQGIDKASRYVPDLILLDLYMPDMDGFDVVRQLKSSILTEDIPIIILTGSVAGDNEELGLNLGANDYVHKPFNPAVLKARIRTQLALREQKKSLSLLTQKLQEANVAKSRFVASMSHEIRTPLTTVLGFAEALRNQEIKPENYADAFIQIEQNGRHLLGLINDVLDFSKIEAKQLELNIESYDFIQLINEIKSICTNIHRKNGVDFICDFQYPLPQTIEIDAVRLRQILLNLVSNSVKFTEKGYIRLEISYIPEKNELQFKVTDTGIGMDSQTIEKLFKPFTQAGANITSRYGGTGLGLSISQHLATAMFGEIKVASQLDKGSEFCLHLYQVAKTNVPLIKKEKHYTHQTTNELKLYPLSGRVLLAEDHHVNRQLVEMLLRQWGLEVLSVANGEEATQAVILHNFDLIILDIQMPVMDGVQAAGLIRDMGYLDTPIVALSAHAIKAEIDSFMESGFDDYCPKPIDRRFFYGLLAKYLTADKTVNIQANQALINMSKKAENALIDDFIADLIIVKQCLIDAQAMNNKKQLAKEVHKLKGSAGSFSFHNLSLEADKLEKALIPTESLASVEPQLNNLLKQIDEVLAK